MFHNKYKSIIQIRLIVLGCRTCLYDYIFEIYCELDFHTCKLDFLIDLIYRTRLSKLIVKLDYRIILDYQTSISD